MGEDPVTVRPEDVEAPRPGVRRAIQSADLPALVQKGAPGAYGPSRMGLQVLEAVEDALCAGESVRAALIARTSRDRARGFAAGDVTPEERRFAAAVGLVVACDEALDATARLGEAALPDRPFPLADVERLFAAESLAEAVARDLAGYVEHYLHHADPARRLGDAARLAACVQSHLRRLGLCARGVAGSPGHAASLAALEEAGLRLPAVRYRGLARQGAADEDAPELLDVGVDDVVGNQDVLAAGLKLARAVAAFDLATGKNPRIVDNPVLFVLGAPGCGKTVTAHAVGRAFLDRCREAGLPARFRVIRRTDWASPYQNKSAADLLHIFRDEVFGAPGVAGAYWPDIDTAFAARSDPDIRAEEKANLATLFGILDGTVGPRNGKWFLLCDANTMAMDEAMSSRLAQDPKLARGPETAADYVRLLRDVKLKGWRDLLPPDPEWTQIGERLRASALSGRAVAAIAGRVAADLQDVEEPPGFLALGYEEKRAALRAAARPVDAARILAHVSRYVQFEKDAADRAHGERFARRVEEIRLQLSAHAAALGPSPADPD